MKKLIGALLISLSLVGCGRSYHTPEEKTYKSYGIANMHDVKSDKICYEISILSVVLATLFIETGIIPVYIVLFDLYQPIGQKPENGKCSD